MLALLLNKRAWLFPKLFQTKFPFEYSLLYVGLELNLFSFLLSSIVGWRTMWAIFEEALRAFAVSSTPSIFYALSLRRRRRRRRRLHCGASFI